MEIKFKIGKFLDALSLISLTVDKTGNLETRDVLFSAVKNETEEKLYLYATNYINQSAIKLDIKVIEAGDLPFNPAQLNIALSGRDPESEATIISNSKQSVIKIGKSKFKLQTSGKLNLLPRLKAVPFGWKADLTFTNDKLVDIFTRAKACVSTDVNNTNRYLMRGMHLRNSGQNYIVESTDGFSAANIIINDNISIPDIDLIIPGDFTNIILKLAAKAKKANSPIHLINTNNIFFGLSDYLVGTALITGKFPDISKVINTPAGIFTVDKSEFKSIITRILGFDSFSTQGNGIISLSVADKLLNVKSTTQLDVEESLDIETANGTSIPNRIISIDGRKLLEIINTFSLGRVSIGISEIATDPLYLEEKSENKIDAKYILVAKRN